MHVHVVILLCIRLKSVIASVNLPACTKHIIVVAQSKWCASSVIVLLSCIFLYKVPLGILPKCETKHADMISIMDTLHQYVPTVTTKETTQVTESEEIDFLVDRFHYLLFGGDMLTAKRARGGQDIRSNLERGKDRLEGLVPVIEDGHTKVCLLGVSKMVQAVLQAGLLLI